MSSTTTTIPDSPDTAALPQVRSGELSADRLARTKYAYTTRHAAQHLAAAAPVLLDDPRLQPQPGDLVLARVNEIGQHTRLESPAGRRQLLFPGDEILLAYAHRYAPDQFEAIVPDDLGPSDLIAAGGLTGRVVSRHAAIDEPTRLTPLGLLGGREGRLTLADHAPRRPRSARTAPVEPRVVVVLGTSMNSGKSTTVASLVHGLRRAGLRVTAGKATGTGAGGDPGMFADAGADQVLDFTDYGFASTYRLGHDRVRSIFSSLVEDLAASGPDVVVLEVADGLYQQETARLLADPLLAALTDDVIFAAGDALGAVAGRRALTGLGLPLRAVSGRLTAAPLAAREACASIADLPVVDTAELCDPQVAGSLLP